MSLLSIYVLLRMEMIHQSVAHVRLLYEGLVTLKYISLDPIERPKLFDGYADIEGYEVPKSLIEWGKQGAGPADIQRMESLLNSMEPDYQKAQQTYTFVDKTGKKRRFANWCNKLLAEQAKECGGELERLYRIVYKQPSAYIHGSPWSLRRQLGYSRAHYRPEVVHNDIAMIIKLTVGVWYEWAKFCDTESGRPWAIMVAVRWPTEEAADAPFTPVHHGLTRWRAACQAHRQRISHDGHRQGRPPGLHRGGRRG
jgi:hypothetical protein